MPYLGLMRTTLTIDDDLLERARAIAEHEQRSLGAVISDCLRKSLAPDASSPASRNGIQLLPRTGQVITPELVNALRDDDE